MCRLCIGDMAKKAKKETTFVIKCPHCLEDDFKLHDVDPSDKIKYYTDTPFKLTKGYEGSGTRQKTRETNDSSIKKVDIIGSDDKSGEGFSDAKFSPL